MILTYLFCFFIQGARSRPNRSDSLYGVQQELERQEESGKETRVKSWNKKTGLRTIGANLLGNQDLAPHWVTVLYTVRD